MTIDFEILRNRNDTTTTTAAADNADASLNLPVGTVVTILKVLQNGKPDLFNVNAKVGDNLRTKKVNNVELYVGLKEKLGNCGGGGQGTFYAIDNLEADGWSARSEWEDQRIGKKLSPTARLACMKNIQGDNVGGDSPVLRAAQTKTYLVAVIEMFIFH